MQSNYQVIARRYRPRSFEEVVGQGAAASTLRNAILQDRLAHAYLFCGPRGVGKTSMARIFARALNCPVARDRSQPESEWGKPCGKCEVCLSVHEGDDIDVIEMDGASNRGIEDVREIIDGVKFAPTKAPFKIYIVDEVHMLTREAFNAFLKVLEEPPAHVKFIFATTEPHKIPDTVLSRCQRFDFHRIGIEDIVQRLAQICQEEGVDPQEGILEKVATYSKGGLRDSQTLLDQLISFSSGQLTHEDLDRITGRLNDSHLDQLLEACFNKDSGGALDFLNQVFQEGTDPSVLLEQLVEALRQKLLLAVRENSDSAWIDQLSGSLQILHDTAYRLKGSPFPQLAVELAVVKLARLEKVKSLEETLKWLQRFEDLARSGAPVPVATVNRPSHSPSPSRQEPSAPQELSSENLRANSPPSAPPPVSESTNGDGSYSSSPVEDIPVEPPVEAGSIGGNPLPTEPMGYSEVTSTAPLPNSEPAVTVAESPAISDPLKSRTGVDPALTEGFASVPEPESPVEVPGPDEAPSPEVQPAPSSSQADYQKLLSVWGQVMIEFKQRTPHLHAFLINSQKEEQSPGALLLRLPSEFHVNQLSMKQNLSQLEALISEVSGYPWKVSVIHDSNMTITKENSREISTGPGLKEHPFVKKTQEIFRGRLC